MSNPGMYLTAGGKSILQRGLLGKEIRFTKAALGSGEFDYDSEKVADLTELKIWQMDLPIVDKKIEGGMVEIIARLQNFNVQNGFAAREIGIYALDPDSGDELLYAYRNAGDEYNFIPGGSGIVKKDIRLGYWVEIDDAPNVTFNIDYSFAHVPQIDFDAHINSKNPHPNTPTHYQDVPDTDFFWVTDFDDDLHKISLADAQNVILADLLKDFEAERTARKNLQEYIEVKDSLGLVEPNILLIENFNPATLVDDTKIKVTSCAKGGNLVSVKSLHGIGIGKEFFLCDGINSEQVDIQNIIISTADVLINNSNYVLELKNNLVNNYNIAETYLQRSTFNNRTAAAPTNSAHWKSRTTFSGRAANLDSIMPLDLSPDNSAAFTISGDGILSGGYFTLI